MTSPPQTALAAGIAALRLDLPPGAQPQLLRYLDELHKWNGAYNLTAIRDPQEMVTKHLLDALSLLPLVHGRVLDVGSGAGIPGLVLAIANPALQVTTLDSNGKKTRFMRHAVRSLGLSNAEVAEARAESFNAPPFDCVVSRAFSSLTDFFDKTAHLLAPGGRWVAMKGKLNPEELSEVPDGLSLQTRRLQVPGLDEERHAVIVQR